jgi:hypothetical protein
MCKTIFVIKRAGLILIDVSDILARYALHNRVLTLLIVTYIEYLHLHTHIMIQN